MCLTQGQPRFIAAKAERMYFSCQQSGTVGNFSRGEISAGCQTAISSDTLFRVPVAAHQMSDPQLRKELEGEQAADMHRTSWHSHSMAIFLRVL